MKNEKKILLIILAIGFLAIAILLLTINRQYTPECLKPRELTLEELEIAFDANYDCSHSDSDPHIFAKEDEWIDYELKVLYKYYSQENGAIYYLPENYEDIYRSWRSNKEDTIGEIAPINLKEFIAQNDEFRKYHMVNDKPFENFEKYMPTDYYIKSLLNLKEIEKLNDQSNVGKFRFSVEEAKEDTELFFRTLRYAYGAYYYWGGQEVFNKAEKQVYEALDKYTKDQITKYDFGNILNEATSFIIDSHYTINGLNQATSNSVKHVYYFTEDEYYEKDDIGYFMVIDDKKWYVEEDKLIDSISICPTIVENGNMYYTQRQFAAKDSIFAQTYTYFTDGVNEKYALTNWQRCTPFAKTSMHEAAVKLIRENGIAYIAVRNFEEEHDAELQNFIKTGIEASKAKAVILDLRSNGGGLSTYCEKWYKNFTGHDVEMKRVRSSRYNTLSEKNHCSLGMEKSNYSITNGKFLDSNNIPVFVLIDENCGSSGEIMTNVMRTLSNVTVIGSNTYGCDFCGDLQYYHLPNSGIIISFGTSLTFYNNMEDNDGIGYLPDIWVNPIDALENTINLVANQNYTANADIISMKEKLNLESDVPESAKNRKINISIGDNVTFKPQEEINFSVSVEDRLVYDAIPGADNPNIRIYPQNNGTFSILCSVVGDYKLYISVDGLMNEFNLFVRE